MTVARFSWGGLYECNLFLFEKSMTERFFSRAIQSAPVSFLHPVERGMASVLPRRLIEKHHPTEERQKIRRQIPQVASVRA
jgi:hypothetical protein